MSDIVQNLRSFYHTLRHDGVDYRDYIEPGKNLTLDEEDFDNALLLQGRRGMARVRWVFEKLDLIVTKINEAIAAFERTDQWTPLL